MSEDRDQVLALGDFADRVRWSGFRIAAALLVAAVPYYAIDLLVDDERLAWALTSPLVAMAAIASYFARDTMGYFYRFLAVATFVPFAGLATTDGLRLLLTLPIVIGATVLFFWKND